MKTLLVYASKYGCTEKVAGLLGEKLSGEVVQVNLEKDKAPDPAGFDTVVVGGSIYVGKVQPSVNAFLQKHFDTLMQKKVGLYLCCASLDQLDKQMITAFPEPLYSHAVKEHLGFAYDFKQMNFVERTIIKKLAKVKESSETILHHNLERLATSLQ